MFQLVKNLYGGAEVAPPLDNLSFEADADLKAGTVVKMKDGDKVEAVADDDGLAIGVAVNDADAGEDVRILYIVPGMIFRAPIEGDVENNMEVGFTQAELAESGTKVKGEGGNADGPLTVLSIDGDEEYAWVAFNECALAK